MPKQSSIFNSKSLLPLKIYSKTKSHFKSEKIFYEDVRKKLSLAVESFRNLMDDYFMHLFPRVGDPKDTKEFIDNTYAMARHFKTLCDLLPSPISPRDFLEVIIKHDENTLNKVFGSAFVMIDVSNFCEYQTHFANNNSEKKGFNFLHFIVSCAQLSWDVADIIKLCVEQGGIGVNEKAMNGITPLEIVLTLEKEGMISDEEYRSIVGMLIELGADSKLLPDNLQSACTNFVNSQSNVNVNENKSTVAEQKFG